jgi:hypothetical protein
LNITWNDTGIQQAFEALVFSESLNYELCHAAPAEAFLLQKSYGGGINLVFKAAAAGRKGSSALEDLFYVGYEVHEGSVPFRINLTECAPMIHLRSDALRSHPVAIKRAENQ